MLDRAWRPSTSGDTIRNPYEGFIRRNVRPVLGRLQVGGVNSEVLDRF